MFGMSGRLSDYQRSEDIYKEEFGSILKEAGGLKASWYLPFPDYKLPMTIYSDERLPFKGELNRLETNYDRLRLQLFQESPVYDSLLDNDLFPIIFQIPFCF